MFAFAAAFNQAIGQWNVSQVTDMREMFRNAAAFNQDIGQWNVSQVTDMYGMFQDAAAFNQDIGQWDVSQVTTMYGMFWGAAAFNQDIGQWNVSQVTDMYYMFANADVFNQDISQWNVSAVTNMEKMFYDTYSFNQDIRGWAPRDDVTLTDTFLFNTGDYSVMNGQYNASTGSTSDSDFDATPDRNFFDYQVKFGSNKTSSPTVTSNENQDTVGNAAATHKYSYTLSYSKSGTDAGDFNIDNTTGALTFATTPNYETKSTYTVIVTATDGINNATQTITVNVTNVNETPTFTSLATFNVAENQTTVGTVNATDPDSGAVVTYSITGGADQNAFDIDDSSGELTFITAPNFESPGSAENSNEYEVIVNATDGTNNATQTITVNVTNVNVVFSSSSLTINVTEDSLFEYTVPAASDGNSDDTISYSLQGGPSWISSFDAATRKLTGTPTNNHIGTDNNVVTIRATEQSNTYAEFTLTINVINKNDIPVFNPTSATVNATEDSMFSYTVAAASDVDSGDEINYSYEGGPDWISSFNPTTRQLLGTPLNANVGTTGNIVVIRATDNEGAYADFILTINVINTNDAPLFDPTSAIVNATEDSLFTYTVAAASDVDSGDSLTYSMQSGPSWVSFDASTRELSGKPLNIDVGADNTVSIKATDDEDAYGFFTLTINVTNTNDTPAFSPTTGSVNATEDTAFSYTVAAASDVDSGDSLTYSKQSGPDWVSFDASTRELSGTPLNANVGATGNTVVIRATDNEGAYADFILTITVSNKNDTPVFNPITGTTTATKNSPFTYIVASASDVDTGDSLRYDKISGPSWVLFNTTTRVLTGTPKNDDLGNNNIVVIRATDEFGAYADFTLTITVENINDPPTITSSATFTVAENQTTIGKVEASDAEGNTLTYSVTNDELAISSTGVLTFKNVPDYETKKTYNATVTVSDGTNSTTQDITVNVTNINETPTITSLAIFSALENQTEIGNVTATDPEGATLTYSVSGSELAISLTGALTFVTAPDYETKNTYTATVTVSDGTNNATQDITVNVTSENEELPTFTSSAIFTTIESQKVIGTVKATDGDNDSLTYFVDGTELEIDMISGVLTFKNTPNYNVKSTYNAKVTVSDGVNTATQDITVNVKSRIDESTPLPSDGRIGYMLKYNVKVNTSEGESASVSVSGPEWLRFPPISYNTITTTNYLLSGIPSESDAGNNNFVITVTVGNLTTTESFTVFVSKNVPPVFTSTPITEARQESLYSYKVTTSDANDDNVIVSGSKIPNWLSFNPTTNTLSGIPPRSEWGEKDIILTATDGYVNVNQEFKIMVRKPICFNKGTKILCLKDGREQYIAIQELREGDQVKTLNHGYKKIIDMRKGRFSLNGLMDIGMYRMKKQGNMIADLEMSGLHAVLVNKNDVKYADDIKRQKGKNNPKFYIDGKFRLRARESHEFQQMEQKEYTIFSFALEEPQRQYGIWANGVLVETTDLKNLEISNMERLSALIKGKHQ